MPIIPALGRLRKENSEFETGLSYIIRPLPANGTNQLHQIPTQDIRLLGGSSQLAHIKENKSFVCLFRFMREGLFLCAALAVLKLSMYPC